MAIKAKLVYFNDEGVHVSEKEVEAWNCYNDDPQVVEVTLPDLTDDLHVSLHIPLAALRKEVAKDA